MRHWNESVFFLICIIDKLVIAVIDHISQPHTVEMKQFRYLKADAGKNKNARHGSNNFL